MAVNVLSLFAISGEQQLDRGSLSLALIEVKTANVIRAAHRRDPAIIPPDIPDNVAIAGPQSEYDFYI